MGESLIMSTKDVTIFQLINRYLMKHCPQFAVRIMKGARSGFRSFLQFYIDLRRNEVFYILERRVYGTNLVDESLSVKRK